MRCCWCWCYLSSNPGGTGVGRCDDVGLGINGISVSVEKFRVAAGAVVICSRRNGVLCVDLSG